MRTSDRMKVVPEPGQIFEVAYPFVFEECANRDSDGAPLDDGHWRAGLTAGEYDQYSEVCEQIAHGEGKQILTVVSIHRPGHYAVRVFYTQRWVDPDGKEFGKNTCRVMVLEKFRRRAHKFEIPYTVQDRGMSNA